MSKTLHQRSLLSSLKRIFTSCDEIYWAVIVVLIIFFAAHLIKLSSPPLDAHAWRQSDTAAVARNFMRTSANIFYPRIDLTGSGTGIGGMEFPFYNYLFYISNIILGGFAYWHGRLITVIFGTLAVLFLYLYTRITKGPWAALIASLGLASSPLFFYFSRNIQPDVPMVALCLAGLLFSKMYEQSGRMRDMVLAGVFLSLGFLTKLPGIYVLPVAVYHIFKRSPALSVRKRFVIAAGFAAGSIVLPIAWYIWGQHLNTTFGLGDYFYNAFDIHASLTYLQQPHFYTATFYYPIRHSILIGIGFSALAAVGIFNSLRSKDALPTVWLLTGLAFMLGWAHKTFFHNYYALPLVPVLAYLAGIGFQSVTTRWSNIYKVLLASVVFLLGIHSFLIWVPSQYQLSNPELATLSHHLDDWHIPTNVKIVTNDESPTSLVAAGRKGWDWAPQDFSVGSLQLIHTQGCEYVVLDKKRPLPPISFDTFHKVAEDSDFVVWSLQ